MNIRNLIDELAEKHILTKEELVYIIKKCYTFFRNKNIRGSYYENFDKKYI